MNGGTMLQAILTGQAKSISLLLWAFFLFIYFLPSVLAFARGHRRFFVILVLNVLSVAGAGCDACISSGPVLLAVDPQNPASMAIAAIAANLGAGWIALHGLGAFAGRARSAPAEGAGDQILRRHRALPLILWFGYGALQLRAVLAHDWRLIAGGTASLFIWVSFSPCWRRRPSTCCWSICWWCATGRCARSKGVLPRAFGFDRHLPGRGHPAAAGGASQPADADVRGAC